LGDNKFELSSLPFSAQLSPVYAIEPGDFNKDGNIDLILAGNFFGTRIRYGRYDANKGVLLMGDGHGHFKEVPNIQSGLYIKGEVKDITELKINSGNKLMIYSLNNDEIKLYKF
jgi:hypothetical protein